MKKTRKGNMLQRSWNWTGLIAVAAAMALAVGCGDDPAKGGTGGGANNGGANNGGVNNGGGNNGGVNNGGTTGSDRGGPHSLTGFEWTSDPVMANGIEFVLSFMFDEDSVTASNTCNGSVTATTEAPVRYRYTANVTEGASNEVEDGGNTCFVEIFAGEFDFEIVNNRLVVSAEDESFEFEPSGSVAGLYGEWTASGNGNTLTWTMGDGKIVATNECDSGLSVTTEAAAEFENILDIEQASENTVEDDFGLECTVSIQAGTSTYYFDGDTLVMEQNGEEVRFEKM